MRMSRLFGKTLRQVPAEAETPSHRLLLRAGMVAQIAAGVYAYLPLAWAALQKIERVIREEMDREGGQEMLMPSLLPLELYQESGRDVTMADILLRVRDHRQREFALGPTHEEAFVEVYKRNVRSYRDLPLLVYQIAPKFRDEPRPRGGLIRLRQFIMKDLYSFDTDWEGLDISYQKMFDAYVRIFDRCGVPTVPVLADSGAMGGRDTHEFIFPTESGEDSCLFCPSCGYAANAEVAAFVKEPAHRDEAQKPAQEIDTPGLYTIGALAEHLGVPESRTCKAVFYTAVYTAVYPAGEKAKGRLQPASEESAGLKPGLPGELREEPVFVAIRGDMEVNEAKLRKALGAVELRYMSDQEAAKAGFVAGSASAVGLVEAAASTHEPTSGPEDPSHKPTSGPGAPASGQIRVVADDLVPRERNLVAGANKPDKHLLNVNYDRDWKADIVTDIALAREGYLCAQCRTPMDLKRGVEMGQVFKLGTFYSEKMGATYLDAEGKLRPAVMGSYGIGVERLLAAVIEANHDDAGIVWPRLLAPFDVHLVALQPERAEVQEAAEHLYDELRAAGLAVLYDDREETPGVKFNDADLLGMPLRVTVSPRNLKAGSLELKARAAAESELVPLAEAVPAIRSRLQS